MEIDYIGLYFHKIYPYKEKIIYWYVSFFFFTHSITQLVNPVPRNQNKHIVSSYNK